MNFIAKFRLLPANTKKLVGLGITIALVIALPLFIWGITTQKFDIRKRAATGEPVPAQECDVCGGIAGIKCAEGLRCEYDNTVGTTGKSSNTEVNTNGGGRIFPDQTGICVLLSGRSSCPITPTEPPIPTITANCNYSCNETINPPVGCATGLTCRVKSIPGMTGQSGVCRNPSCPNETDCVCPAPIAKCNESCGGMPGPTGTTRATCESGLYCKLPGALDAPGVCRNSNCPDKIDCTCGGEIRHQNFIFKVKLAGVADEQAENAKMQVRFRNKSLSIDYATIVTLHHVGGGVYEANFGFDSEPGGPPVLPNSTGYTIYLKAEKHIAKKICALTQTERCTSDGNILINGGNLYEGTPDGISKPSPQVFDVTALPLEPGDLPVQDGVANGNDFAKIKGLLTKSCSELTVQEKYTADLDYNGCINIRDAFLMRKTLETKYDEE